MVRDVRRGSASIAFSALHEQGLDALVAEIGQDRVAKSAIPAQETRISAWRRFHQEAFRLHTPAISALPVTAPSIVAIGSIFKTGDYRSFPNYIVAAKSSHIKRPSLSGASCSSTPLRGSPGACFGA